MWSFCVGYKSFHGIKAMKSMKHAYFFFTMILISIQLQNSKCVRLSTFDHRGFCYLKMLGVRHFLSGVEEVLDRLVTLQVVEGTLYRQALWTTAGDPGGAQIWRAAATAEGVGRALAGHWC